MPRGRPKKYKELGNRTLQEYDKFERAIATGYEEPLYTVTLATGGKTYVEQGITIEDALVKMDLSWENIKMKGILTIQNKDKSHEHLLNVKQLRRIFSNKLVRGAWCRNLEYLMK